MKSTNCPNCGNKINEEVHFCGTCGQNVIQPTKEIKVKATLCPKCNTPFEKDEKFCTECGTAINKDTPKKVKIQQKKQVQQSKPRPTPTPKQNPSKKKKKRGILRTIRKVVLGFIAFVIVGSVILYYMGDDVTTDTPMKVREANAVLTDASTYPIVPSLKEQVFSYTDRIKVTLPPEFTLKKQSLAISNATIDKAVMVEDYEPLMLVDLTLDDGKQPAKPVEISYKYNKTDLNPNFTAEEQLAAYRWDEKGGGWVSLPVLIDETNQTISAIVDHFSIPGFFIKASIGAQIDSMLEERVFNDVYVTPNKNFKILYSKKAILADPDLNTPVWRSAPTGKKSSSKSKEPAYILAIGHILEEALKSYTKDPLFFKNPGGKQKGYLGTYQKTITVKIDSWLSSTRSGDARYENIYERLHIPTSRAFQYYDAKITLAHELFHRIQAQYYGISGMILPSNQWWLEATAEFAAYELAWKPPLDGMDKSCGNNYLTFPINSRGDKSTLGYGWTREYEYVTSNFIKYLIDNGLDFKKAIVNDASDYSSSINSLEKFLMEKHKVDLTDIYRAFSGWMVFSPSGILKKYPIATFTANSNKDIAVKNNKFNLGEGKEIFYDFNMIGAYSSKLWAIQLNKSKTLKTSENYKLFVKLKKRSTGVNVDIFIIPKGKRSINPYSPVKTLIAEGQSVEINVEEGSTLCIMTSLGHFDDGIAEVVVSEGVFLEIDPPKILDAKANSSNYFTVTAKNIPKEIEKVNFEWDYNDGSEKASNNYVDVSNGEASIKLQHSYEESDKEENYPLEVKLKDYEKGKKLAEAVAMVTLPIKNPTVFITERHITGPPGATFDVEALASPVNTYNFVWTVEGMAEEFTQTGKKSGIAPVINKIGEYTYTVKLYSLDGTFLDEDRVTVYVESDELNAEGIDGIVSIDDENNKGQFVLYDIRVLNGCDNFDNTGSWIIEICNCSEGSYEFIKHNSDKPEYKNYPKNDISMSGTYTIPQKIIIPGDTYIIETTQKSDKYGGYTVVEAYYYHTSQEPTINRDKGLINWDWNQVIVDSNKNSRGELKFPFYYTKKGVGFLIIKAGFYTGHSDWWAYNYYLYQWQE